MKTTNNSYKAILLLTLILSSTISFSQKNTHLLKAKAFYKQLQSSENPVIIDVRPAKKFSENRIDNAISMESLDDLEELLKDIPKDQTIMLYCQKGDRSKQSRIVFEELDFTNVYELKNGLNTWIKAGLPLDTTKLK